MRTERLTILVTPAEKAAMTEMAAGFDMSVGELLRYGFELAQEMGSPSDLEALANSVSHDMQRTIKLLDETNAVLEASYRERHPQGIAAE